jgi:hypothetical protein
LRGRSKEVEIQVRSSKYIFLLCFFSSKELKLILLIPTGEEQRRIAARIFSAQRVLSVLTSHGSMCSIWILRAFFHSVVMFGRGLQENEEEAVEVWGFLGMFLPCLMLSLRCWW